jgi:hypothetical protein
MSGTRSSDLLDHEAMPGGGNEVDNHQLGRRD